MKAFFVFILSLLYLTVVFSGNPFKSVVWDKQQKQFIVTCTHGLIFIYSIGPNTESLLYLELPGYTCNYDQGTSTLTAVVDDVTYKIEFNFSTGVATGDLPYSLTTKILMGSGISVIVVVIIGRLYYFLSAPVPSPIDRAEEKKAKLPKKDSKSGKSPIKGKASKENPLKKGSTSKE